jgi:hypothetical protein
MTSETNFKPFDGQANLERKELAKYLNRVGRGVNCRLDVPILVMSDVKWAATVFSELAKQLTELAFVDDRSEIWRILAARSAMEQGRSKLAHTNQQKTSIKLAAKAREDSEKNRSR